MEGDGRKVQGGLRDIGFLYWIFVLSCEST
jgi:hypothetical protein